MGFLAKRCVGRSRGLFTQERVAVSANLFLDGLLDDERRKTGWMRAEAAGRSHETLNQRYGSVFPLGTRRSRRERI